VERDLPQLGITIGADDPWFWTMLAHYHAQVWNGAELGGPSASPNPVKRYPTCWPTRSWCGGPEREHRQARGEDA
jgi:hypothetical protein